MIVGILESLRPKQWTKNLLVFAGFLFTIEQGHSAFVLLRSTAAFALFCAVSGAGYIFNDILDIASDRSHPRKRLRPLPSGRVSTTAAAFAGIALALAALLGAFALNLYFGILAVCYLAVAAAYSTVLKHVVILDLLLITAGFVIRAAAGAVVIGVAISPWLVVCTTLLALFLGCAKRRAELAFEGCETHRRTLGDYTVAMLDQMLSITASACLMAYFLYTFTPASPTGRAHPYMMITTPFVVYGLFRYLFLVHTRNAGDTPERLIIEDKPLLVNLLLYVASVVAALSL